MWLKFHFVQYKFQDHIEIQAFSAIIALSEKTLSR